MSKPQSITFEGLPPSVNNIYFNAKAGGRRKTDEYRDWITATSWHINQQHPEKVTGDVVVDLFCRRPVNKDGSISKVRRDLDNLFKASLDLLVSNNLIEDDSKVVAISAEWSKRPDLEGTLIMYSPA